MCTATIVARTTACRIRPEPWSTCCTPTLHTPLEAWSSKPGVALELRQSPWLNAVRTHNSRRLMSPRTRPRKPKRTADAAGITNVQFQQADIFALPFAPESFDHVFICFVLEHLSRPAEALTILNQLLRPGGTMTVIEGDHGSTYFHPDSSAARMAIQCLVELQRLAGGNALIGRQLYPLMVEAGLEAIHVSPRMVYVDSSRPDLVNGFTRKTFTAMIEGVRESAIAAGITDPEAFDAGVRDLHRTTEADGVFCYTFFKSVGEKHKS